MAKMAMAMTMEMAMDIAMGMAIAMAVVTADKRSDCSQRYARRVQRIFGDLGSQSNNVQECIRPPRVRTIVCRASCFVSVMRCSSSCIDLVRLLFDAVPRFIIILYSHHTWGYCLGELALGQSGGYVNRSSW